MHMKLVVAGLGAVGGLVAARLALAGHAVTALARPAVVDAVTRRGGLLHADPQGQEQTAPVHASFNAAGLGVADVLFIALKGPALANDAPQLAPLIGPDTVVLPLMNGVPWWFMHAVGDDAPLASVDPQGLIAATLPLRRTLGAVVHLTCSSPAPGVVRHGFGERIIVGAADPTGDPAPVVDLLASAGFKAELSDNIRRDIWFKLWGNMTMNPISALTRAPCDAILDDTLLRAFMARGMAEAAAIGAKVGCPIDQSAEDRMNVTRQLGAFKTSMLQDAEAGRRLEYDALVGAVREIGQRVGVDTPNIDALLGLTRMLASSLVHKC
jgi:2-dehydropantoate 2-reductase